MVEGPTVNSSGGRLDEVEHGSSGRLAGLELSERTDGLQEALHLGVEDGRNADGGLSVLNRLGDLLGVDGDSSPGGIVLSVQEVSRVLAGQQLLIRQQRNVKARGGDLVGGDAIGLEGDLTRSLALDNGLDGGDLRLDDGAGKTLVGGSAVPSREDGSSGRLAGGELRKRFRIDAALSLSL